MVNPSVSLNQGDLLNLACAAAFGAHIACLERYTRRGDTVSLFVWQLVIVTAVMIPGMIIESPQPARFAPTALLLVTLTITGVFATGAFAVQMWVQQVVPAQRVALIFSLEPVFAAWLAWYFLGEHLDPTGWLGSGLILIAVLLGTTGQAVTKVTEPVGSPQIG